MDERLWTSVSTRQTYERGSLPWMTSWIGLEYCTWMAGFIHFLRKSSNEVTFPSTAVPCSVPTRHRRQMCHGEEFSTCCFLRSPDPLSLARSLAGFHDRLTSYRYLLHVRLFVLPSRAPLLLLPRRSLGREKSVVSTDR